MKPAPEHFTKDNKKNTHNDTTKLSSPRIISTRDQLTRFAKSLRGVLTGIVLFALSLPILFLNESTVAQKHSDVQKGLRNVKSAEPVVNEYLENKIVHISGVTTAQGNIIDKTFSIDYDGLKLKRIVEMLQWEEVSSLDENEKPSKDAQENASFVYSKIWSDTIINSTQFNDIENYTNPNIFSLQGKELPANDIKLGSLKLSRGSIKDLSNYESVTIGQIGASNDAYTVVEQSTMLYNGKDYANPQVGDLRVHFEVIPEQTYTIVGEYEKGTLYPYVGNNQTLSLIESGEVSREEMFIDVERTNHAISWIMRLLGTLMMFAGLWLMFGPITSLAALIPMLGRVTRDATALFIVITTAVFVFGILTLAWALYQPAIGLPLLLVALLAFILYHFLIKEARKKIAGHVKQSLGFAAKPIIDGNVTSESKKENDIKNDTPGNKDDDASQKDTRAENSENSEAATKDSDSVKEGEEFETPSEDEKNGEDIDGVSKEKEMNEIEEKSVEDADTENKERAEDFNNESGVIEETPSKDDIDKKTEEELKDLQEDKQEDLDEKSLGDDIEDIAEDIAEAIEESIEKTSE